MQRKPLVRFESSERAQLVSSNSMPARKRSRGGSRSRRTTKGKPRIVKGRLSLKVAGYSGYQRLPASKLIPYLPISKLRVAAKRALSKTKKTGSKTRRKRIKRRKNVRR